MDKRETMSLPDRAVDHIYTPLKDAVAEIYRRRKDSLLRAHVQRLLATLQVQPTFVTALERPVGLYCRNIISPNHEFNLLQQIFPGHVLEPVLLEYNAKFVARNNDSYHLCRLRFEHPTQPSGECRRIVDFNTYEGRRFCEIQTLTGEPLHHVHRRLLAHEYGGLLQRIGDISEWFDHASEQHAHKYFHYLSLFVTHGVLFENFLAHDTEEQSLVLGRVLPAFNAVCETFGVKPLIVRIMPKSSEYSRYWNMYPAHLLHHITEWP